MDPANTVDVIKAVDAAEGTNNTPFPNQSLITHLWPRVRASHDALRLARLRGDAPAATAHALRFRMEVLLMASEPARTWTEVEPKVLAQGLVRHDVAAGIGPADDHLDGMLEAAIMADHEYLNSGHLPTFD